MYNRAFFLKNFSPLDLKPLFLIAAYKGVDKTGTVVNSLTDLTGNGNNFDSVGDPEYVENGINGFPSIRFNGANRLELLTPVPGVTDLDKRVYYVVFQIEEPDGVTYHNVFFLGATSYTGSVGGAQLYIPNSSNSFNHNLTVNTLDATVFANQLDPHFAVFRKSTTNAYISIDGGTEASGAGTQNINNLQIFVGQWNGRGAKMLLSEFAMFNGDALPASGYTLLKKYFKGRYGISSGDVTVVWNMGVNGNNTSDVISRLTTINDVDAGLVILMIGTNDWRHPTGSKRRTPTQYKDNLVTIVQSLKANGSDVLILDFPPIIEEESDYVCAFYSEPSGCDVNATADAFRAKILEVVSEETIYHLDINQEFIDVGQPTNLASSYIQNLANSGSTDGVHPTALGAAFIAQLIYDFLIENELSYTKIVCAGDSVTAGDGLTGANTVTGDTYPAKLKELLNA